MRMWRAAHLGMDKESFEAANATAGTVAHDARVGAAKAPDQLVFDWDATSVAGYELTNPLLESGYAGNVCDMWISKMSYARGMLAMPQNGSALPRAYGRHLSASNRSLCRVHRGASGTPY